MRHILLILLVAMAAMAVPASGAEPDTALVKTLEQFELARRDTVFATLRLSPEESAAFIPLYDSYRERCGKLADRQIAQLHAYAAILQSRTVDGGALRSHRRCSRSSVSSCPICSGRSTG